MTVSEGGFYSVIAHGLQRQHADLALAGLQHLLPRAMALHLGRRGVNTHQLQRQHEALAVGECHFELARLLVQRDFGGAGCPCLQTCHQRAPQNRTERFTCSLASPFLGALELIVVGTTLPVTTWP